MKWFRVRKTEAGTAGAMIGGAGGKTSGGGGAGAGAPKRNFFRKAGAVLLGTIFTGLVGTAAAAQGGGIPATGGGGREDINIPNATLTNSDGEGMANTLAQQPPRRAEAQKIDTVEKFRQVLLDLGIIRGTGDAEFNSALGKIGLSQRAILEGKGNASAIRLLNALNNYLYAKNRGMLRSFDAMDTVDSLRMNVGQSISDYEERASLAEADFCVNSASTQCGGLASAIGELLKNDPGKVDEVTKMIFVMSTLDAEGKTVAPAQAIAGVETGISAIGGRQVSDPGKIVEAIGEKETATTPFGVVATKTEKKGGEGKYESIKDLDAATLIKRFEKTPSDYGLVKLYDRLKYLHELESDRKKKAGAQKEIAQISKWLSELGLMYPLNEQGKVVIEGGEYTPEELRRRAAAETPERALGILRAGLMAVQEFYQSVAPNEPGLVEYLKEVSSNKKLSMIYREYVSLLDKEAGGIFNGIRPSDKDYLKKIKMRIDSRLDLEDVQRARAAWLNDYISRFAPAGEEMSLADVQLYGVAGELDPLTAMALHEYLTNVANNGLWSEEEKKLVAMSAAKLRKLSPLLVRKYFAAIAHLADICEDNRDAFLRAMTEFSTRVDMATEPYVSSTSPARISPVSMRAAISNLSSAFDEIRKIDKSVIAQYNRFNILDDHVRVNTYPPHSIEQLPPRWAPRLLLPDEYVQGVLTPYPFDIYTPFPATASPYTTGNVTTSPLTYGGGLQLGSYSHLWVPSGAMGHGLALRNYLHPQHPYVSPSDYLPGVNISSLSATRLLMEINRAFIPTNAPEYGGPVIGGGGFGGVAGRKPAEEDWDVIGGTMGSIITPPGGGAWGGGAEEQGDNMRAFAGATSVAVPVARIEGDKIHGLDSAIAGYEQTFVPVENAEGESELTAAEQEILARAIMTHWNPKNPAQSLVVFNRKQDADKKAVMTARYYYIEKDGTIFELKGGMNDFVKALNFAAGYGNANFDSPTTYVWNVEPTIDRGGGAISFDIGKTSALLHAQAIPYPTEVGVEETVPMPLLLQWTPAVATTVDKNGKKTDIHIVSAPGKMLRMWREGDESIEEGHREDNFFVQDVGYTMRRVREKSELLKLEEKSDWELSVGGGVGKAELEREVESATGEMMVDEEQKMFGRGGFFFRSQNREKVYERAGGGVSYEAGATNLEAMAVLSEAEEATDYITSLHRIAATAYKGGAAEKVVIGGLLHVVEQLREVESEEGARSETKHDHVFWRTVGLLKGLESEFGLRFDTSRFSGLDEMMTEYEALGARIGQSPQNAGALMDEFESKYKSGLSTVFDRYYLGMRISRRASMEAMLVAQEDSGAEYRSAEEKAGEWASQKPQDVQGRVLINWNTGFWRAFASAPLGGYYGGAAVQQDTGIVGSGVGQDMFNGFFLQRAAFDAGILLVREIAENTEETGAAPGENIPEWKWKEPGAFVEGAMRVFSNILEDSNKYRRLVAEYDGYVADIRRGNYKGVPRHIRNLIVEHANEAMLGRENIDQIQEGRKGVSLDPVQMDHVLDVVWEQWFEGRKDALQKDFNGHVRIYLGASGYFYHDKTYWDLGAFVENVKGFRIYAISAQREEFGVYAGLDVFPKHFNLGAIANISETGRGAALSAEWKFGPPEYGYFRLGIYGYLRDTKVPEYVAPMYLPRGREGIPEFGVGMFFRIGEGNLVPYGIQDVTIPGRNY